MKTIMRGILCAIFFSCLQISSTAQPVNYSAQSIPEVLKGKANVVKRYESIVLNVNDDDNATFHIRQVFTVLNEKAKRILLFHQFTTKYIQLKDAEIRVYDSTGKQTSKYKKWEMQTTSIGEGLVEDGQVTYYYVNALNFPVTVEYEYEVKLTGTLSLPSYQVSEEDMSVEESHFSATVPNNVGFRYLAHHIDIKPMTETTTQFTKYNWEVRNMKAISSEEGSGSLDDCYPVVRITLNKFSFYGYNGDLSSWRSFGSWLSNLYKGTDELPADRKQFFTNLVAKAPDEMSKARIIYDYLQRNFRYVSIQLGIGGFRPFAASFTDERKYGDCKGLSNFMKAALGAVGIKSYLAIINAGSNNEPVDPSFPFNDFNHVILCIPRSPDTVWLECTSSSTEFGKLGTFTQNRNALLVTENGGVLVSTPRSKPAENVYEAKAVIKLSNDLSGTCNTVFYPTGFFRELMDHIYKQKRDDQQQSLVRLLSYKQPDDFEFRQDNSSEKQVDSLDVTYEKFHDFKAGSKYFLPQRPYRIWTSKLPKSEPRNFDYYFSLPPFVLSDTTVWQLPDGFSPETLPQAKSLHNNYVDYQTNFRFDQANRSVIVSVSMVLKKHMVPAAEFAEVRKVFDDIMTDEQQKIVIQQDQ